MPMVHGCSGRHSLRSRAGRLSSMETGALTLRQRSPVAVHSFACCPVGLAGPGGFALAYGFLVAAPAAALPWAAMITAALVIASAAASTRPSPLQHGQMEKAVHRMIEVQSPTWIRLPLQRSDLGH